MKYYSITEAAGLLKISSRRLQQLCTSGEIAGAEKAGRKWRIPESSISAMLGKSENQKKPLPVGISDYKDASTEYYYVDKTLLIKDFLDKKPKVSLFTRPRRFGKTLNMDMLRVFFEKTDVDTSRYFRDKAIWSYGNTYTSYQGKYPVIHLSFKDVKCTSWQETYSMIIRLIALEFRRHIELENSEKLNKYEKEQFVALADSTADASEYQLSLQILSLLLHKHYGKETIIIIDEYDTPIQQGHTCGFYNEVIEFMRNFFSGGLKDNSHLAYGFLTGILRVAKESIFSGLNNLVVYSILDKPYSQYFGFTKDEVEQMLTYYGYQEKLTEVCEWYDGYLFGNTEIFNPWSVINYVSEECFPKAFWQSTGSNDIIGEIISSADDDIIKSLYQLLNGDTVTGVSTMYLAHEMDTGDVIYTEETAIGEFETSGELFERLKDMGAALLVKTLRDIEAGIAPRTPQDHSKASYVKMLDKSLCPIDWNRSPRAIVKQICGLQPWPVATMELAGKTCKVFGAAYTETHTEKAPGTILKADDKGIEVACGGGESLLVTELQAPGKKRMAAGNFLRGHPLKLER